MVVGEADAARAFAAGSSLVYGEMLPESLTQLWGALGIAAGAAEVLLETGMGTGKVALQAFAELPHLRRVVGVELAQTRYLAGEAALRRLADARPERFRLAGGEPGMWVRLEELSLAEATARTLEFRCGDLLQIDPAEMAEADVRKHKHT